MKKLVVTDATCLIAFERSDCLWVLPSLFVVAAPPAVERELGQAPSWLQIDTAFDSDLARQIQLELDAGESEAIALAYAKQAGLLIDERKGRRVAERFGLKVTGTAGVVVLARHKGLIEHARPVLDRLRADGLHLSDALYAKSLRLAGEA